MIIFDNPTDTGDVSIKVSSCSVADKGLRFFNTFVMVTKGFKATTQGVLKLLLVLGRGIGKIHGFQGF